MKLYGSLGSPYVRKTMVTVYEAGLQDEVDLLAPSALVWVGDGPSEVVNENPLGKVPVLIRRDKSPLIESNLICEYLASLVPERNLLPSEGDERWSILNLNALAHGAIDAMINRGVETQFRPAELVWEEWITRQSAKIERTLDRFEALSGNDRLEETNLAAITLGSALGYLEQRFQDRSWRKGRPDLANWFDEFAKRASMRATMPPVAPPPDQDPRRS